MKLNKLNIYEVFVRSRVKNLSYQFNKTELLACVAPGRKETIAQFLNLIYSFIQLGGPTRWLML